MAVVLLLAWIALWGALKMVWCLAVLQGDSPAGRTTVSHGAGRPFG